MSHRKENALYDMNLVDSPGYGQDNNKSWLGDITKYIKNHVNIRCLIYSTRSIIKKKKTQRDYEKLNTRR